MLYPTLNQPLMFLLLICAGLASGIIFDLLNLVCNLVREDRFSKIFFDFLSVLLAFSLVVQLWAISSLCNNCIYTKLIYRACNFKIFVDKTG